MGLMPFFTVLKARFAIILWSLMICAGVSVIIGSLIPPRYAAEATIQVDATTENLLTGLMEPRQRIQEFLGQQAAIIGSRAAALLVVDDLVASQDLSLESYEAEWHAKTGGELLPGNDLKMWIADELLSHTQISSDVLKSTLTITYTSQEPALSARYANAFADAYMILVTDYRKSSSARNAENFSGETEKAKVALDQARNDLQTFQQKTGYVTIGTQQIEAAEVELASITARLAEARADNAEAQSLWSIAQRTEREDLSTLPMPTSLAPGRNAQARLSSLVAQMERIDERYGPQHPDYIEAAKEMTRLEDIIYNAVRERATYTASRTKYLSDEVAKRREYILGLQSLKQQFDEREDQVTNAKNTYELTSARTKQEGLQARVETVSIFLLSQAVPPAHASMPTFWVIVAAGIFFGLGLGVSVAVFIELMEGRVRSAQSIEFVTRRPVLAEMKTALSGKRKLFA